MMQRSSAAAPEDAIYRKIARRIVPFLFFCYVVNFIDRVNIGFAKLQFLQDLKLDDAVFGLAAGMFFVGYLVFEVPSNLLLEKIGVRKTLLRIMVLWGSLTVLLMFVKSAGMLYLLRFLLGAAEAGFFPGIILYLTYWFPDRQRGRITSLFIMAVPLAGIIGGPLSGWIMVHFHDLLGLRGWQWLFLIEGVPAIALGVMALLYLDDRPASAKWLSHEEKRFVAMALDADRKTRGTQYTPPAGLADVLRNPRIYLLSAIYFCVFMGLNAIGFWIPTLLRHVGVQQLGHIGWISGGMSVCTAIGIVVIGHSSDRRAERRWHVAACGFAVAASFLLLPFAARSVPFTVALLVVASICIYATLSIFWTIPTADLDGGAAAAGIATITAIGAIGGAVSPSLIGSLATRTGSIYTGFAVIAVLLIAGMIALLWAVPSPRRSPLGTAQPAVPKP
ncbi:MFS transporter [Paraburkholderia sp. D15]|uniref:MFS transporter n=1 Tax=Paraburkholderia sp. D15 TaxID=2880218 RepID=UPI00247A5683|nr:MFS transporter [Paraburkholderia sp. D15]WGS52444.1 MFS transporter [Paraburkholderia sp. D15]